MDKIKILWVDDEVARNHILFLEKKNYEVTTCNNGLDAIAIFRKKTILYRFFGWYTWNERIRNTYRNERKVLIQSLITKSEEESISWRRQLGLKLQII
jgi:hypothetical protein